MDETPMIETTPFVTGAVDYKNRPALRSNSGSWRSAAFIIGVEIAERFAYYGVSANLITYLTGPLGESTAFAAANVNALNGASKLLPLVGASVADAFLGRYRTVIFSLLLNILALGLLTLSSVLPSVRGSTSSSPQLSQSILIFSSLYLLVIAQGGYQPCAQAFGADQFDGQHPSESRSKSSFFNWWYFGAIVGVSLATLILVYVQDNFSWALGFGIPCITMVLSLLVFLLGTDTYRYVVSENDKGPFFRIGRVFVASFKNRHAIISAKATNTTTTTMDASHSLLPREGSEQFKFLNKALIASNIFEEHRWACSVSEVEEAKAVVRLIPIWISCLIYGVVFSQMTTFFTKQGATMERTIFSGFKIPAATLLSFGSVAILVFLPIYDGVLVPIARGFTRNSSGITMLQRIGVGMFISMFAMIIAALVEMRRLEVAEESGLANDPNATVPMSVWWLVPQYVMFGVADVFALVGLQEFFYDQVPMELRSLGLALYLSVIGIGSFLSSFLVWTIDKATSGNGRGSWFSNNLNKAHIDYFYWLLAGLSAMGLCGFVYFSRLYVYNHRRDL